MGLRSRLRGARVYFDTVVFIYLLEGFSAYRTALFDIRDAIVAGETEIVTSELTLCELLVPLFRAGRSDLVLLYRQFVEESGAFRLCPTTRETYVRGSLYRAEFGLKTPDAVHVATAVEAGCDLLLSNDRTMRTPKTIEIVRLSQFAT